MRYVRLAGTELEVSVLALGCGNFGGIGSAPDLIGRGDDEATAFALMDTALEHGITLFDTANAYGGGLSEEWIGRWLASRRARDEIVLTTKVRNRVGPAPEEEGLSKRHILTQIKASLRRLRTDYVDLYLAHEPDPAVPIDETLDAFDELVRAGEVRYVGLSNYSGSQLDEAVRVARQAEFSAPVNLQSAYSLLDQVATDAFAVCAKHHVAFTAYSPLAGGWLARRYGAGQPFPPGSRMTLRPQSYLHWHNPHTYARIEALERAAAERGVPLSVLALAWVLNDPAVSAAVIGPRRPDQLTGLLAVVDLTLDAADRAALASGADVTVSGRPDVR